MPLDENRFGRYPGQLQYSGLTSCVTVTMFTPPNVLVGAHFVVSKASEITAIFAGLRALQANAGGAATQMFIAGPTTMWNNDNLPGMPQYNSMNMVGTFQNRLNFHAETLLLETPGTGELLTFSANAGAVTVMMNGGNVTDDFVGL
jgi:hypothetical protein